MLFFLGSIFLSIYNAWKSKSDKDKTTEVDSMLLKHIRLAFSGGCSIILGRCNSSISGSCRSNYWRSDHVAACLERRMVDRDGKCLILSEPKIKISLHEWTSYISQQDYPVLSGKSLNEKTYVLVSALSESDQSEKQNVMMDSTIKVTEYLTPIAWKSGEMYGIVGECTQEGLDALALAFMNDRLEIGEDPLKLIEICTVGLEGHAQNLIRGSGSNRGSSPFASSTNLNNLRKPFVDDSVPSALALEEESESSEDKKKKTSAANEYLFELRSDDGNSDAGSQCEDELGYFGQDDGAGEVMSSGMKGDVPSTIRLKDVKVETSSQESSPSKGAYNDEGAGEALSPSIEEQSLLAPFRQSSRKMKPPNVLIYCGKKDSQRVYEVLKDIFSICINSDKYVIYHLKHEKVLSDPWLENTACLIISCDRIYDNLENKFLEYFQQGGAVLSFSSTYDSLFTNKIKQDYSGILNLNYGNLRDPVTAICGRTSYSGETKSKLDCVQLRTVGKDTEDRNVIVEAVDESTGGISILSQANLDKNPSDMAISPEIYSILKQANPQRFAVLRELMSSLGLDSNPGAPPPLTEGYLLTVTQDAKDLLYNALSTRLKHGILASNQINLNFISPSDSFQTPIKSDLVPIIVDPLPRSYRFEIQDYVENLCTKELGHTVVYVDVVTSTMPYVDVLSFSVPEGAGLIVIAAIQTGGRGRGGNAWISPEGCAMFSLHMKLSLSTELGQRVSFIQHITSLAVVEAVTSIDSYQDFPLKLKWPNDIYYENKIKVGGVIVNSSVMGNVIYINIGCGVNVKNNNPTSCINELLTLHNQTHGTKLAPLSTAQLIGRTVTEIERLVELFQQKGWKAFVDQYYKKWIHSEQQIEVEGKQATVKGVDEYGYLSVEFATGNIISVHDDGNSFDMTRNVIVPKMNKS